MDEEREVGVVAPLLVVGAWAEVAIRPRLFWTFSVEAFSLKYDKYSGILTNFGSSLDWYAGRHWGLGGEIDLFALDALYDDRDAQETLDFEYRFNGIYVYVSGAW